MIPNVQAVEEMPSLRMQGPAVANVDHPVWRTALGSNAYHAASHTQRDMIKWNPGQGSADSDTLPSQRELLKRNRDIARNSGVAHGGMQTIIDNVVGTGLRLSPNPDYLALGKDKAWAIQFAKQVRSVWQQWSWTTACDAADSMTWDQLSDQMYRSELQNGDAIALPVWIPDRGDNFSTKIMTVEADRLSTPAGTMETTTIRGGIAVDQYGMPVQYAIKKTHPGDFLVAPFGSANPNDWEWINRRGPSGRLQVIHLYEAERSGQRRGVPFMAAVLAQFKNLDRYIEAEVQAAIVNACIAGVITTELDQENIMELFGDTPLEYVKQRREHAVELKPGAMIPLMPGDDLKPFLPARPAAAFEAFIKNIYRTIAVGMDIPYELLMKDFSDVSYASARSSMLEAWRSFIRRRDRFSTKWADPCYALVFEEAVNDGRIDAPDFYKNRAAYLRARWIGPGRGWVDPKNEALASQIRMVAGLSTQEAESAEQGRDWEDDLDQIQVEEEARKARGLPSIFAVAAPTPSRAAAAASKSDETVAPDDAANAADPGTAVPAPGGGGGAVPPKKPAVAAAASDDYIGPDGRDIDGNQVLASTNP